MESSSRTLVCSVVFLDIVEYSKKPVAEQLQLKQSFNGIMTAALLQVAARDRVVLDTGDGAAVTFLGDPEDALFVAMSIRDAAAAQDGLGMRMGINLGPVRLVRDINGQLNIIGDGINVAQRVMSFSRPGQLLVSRSFYEVVSCLSRDYASLFGYEGAHTDKHVREHELYSVGADKRPARHAAEPDARTRGGVLAALTAPGPFGVQRLTLIVAPLVMLLIVGAAAGVKQQREARRAAQLDQPAALAPMAAPAKSLPSAPRLEQAAATKAAPATRPQRPAGAPASGQIVLAVLPWGEVFVDGKSRGVSPPLRVLDVPPGAHSVEIRNASFPAHVERVEVRAGEQTRIRHRFR